LAEFEKMPILALAFYCTGCTADPRSALRFEVRITMHRIMIFEVRRVFLF